MTNILKHPFETKRITRDFDTVSRQFRKQQSVFEQNLVLGILAGTMGAVVGAFLWAAISLITGWQIGFMAIGVGFLVGIAVRMAGKGSSAVFGCVGALLSLFGCVLGNFLAICIAATTNEFGLLDILSTLTPEVVVDAMAESFHPIDLVFYGLALYTGYRLSIGKTLEDEYTDGSL